MKSAKRGKHLQSSLKNDGEILYWVIALLLIGVSIVSGIFIGIPLTCVLLLFFVYCQNHGHKPRVIFGFMMQGAKKSVPVLTMLLLIAINTALWLSSGCIAALIHYGIRVMVPSFYLPMCFLFCAAVSYLLGSSLATSSTVGIVCYTIGVSSGVPAPMAVGAVISGIYVGDRCSPISSSLFLLSSLTDFPHIEAKKIALKTSLAPLLITCLLFAGLSAFYPMRGGAYSAISALADTFKMGVIALLPALVIMVLSLFHMSMSKCLLFSSITALIVSVLYQGEPVKQLFGYMLNGFLLPAGHSLSLIMKGGGLLPMLKSIYVVVVSCALASVIEKGKALPARIETFLCSAKSRSDLNLRGAAMGLLCATVGCNQTMSIVTTSALMRKPYENMGLSPQELFTDLSFNCTLLSVLPPWALAVSLPLAALQYGRYDYIPFMFFILLAPVFHAFVCWRRDKGKIDKSSLAV